MATTATTPKPPGRHSSLHIGTNQRNHSARIDFRHANPPDAPIFLEEPLFLQGLSNGAAALFFGDRLAPEGTAKPTAAPAPRKTLAPSVAVHETVSIDVDHGSNARTKKRSATEVLDLTHTTTNSVEEGGTGPVATSNRQMKRLKMPLAAGTANTGTLTANHGVKKKGKKSDRNEKQEKLAQESAMWRAKYKKAFPSFTFYFDTIDEATKAQLGAQVKKLGSSVDQFFSKKVTHVVTTRSVPSQSNKENVDSPAVTSSKSGTPNESAVGKAKTHNVRSPESYSRINAQKLRLPVGEFDKNPFIDAQDILSKAIDFKLKIWSLDKLNLILARINSHSPNKADAALQRNPSLPSLLRDEQLYGTRERDPFVPRSDMHYFPSNKYYLLVEDTTGAHRPIVIQEYDKPCKHEDPSWPVLWGGIEGRSGFYKYEGPPIKYQTRFDPNLLPKQASVAPSANTADGTKLMAGFSTTAARAVGAPNLRRAISLLNVPRAGTSKVAPEGHEDSKHAAPGGIHRRDSYIAASGNSQIITSNTGTSTRSGAAMQAGTGKGSAIDKRIAVLANRTVSVPMGGASSRQELGNVTKSLKRSISVDSEMKDARRFVKPREEPKKPGYCENCRLKYDDFKTHIVSNKHRRFAENGSNWLELDELLHAIARRTTRKESVLSPSQSSVSSAEDSGFFEPRIVYSDPCDDTSDSDDSNS